MRGWDPSAWLFTHEALQDLQRKQGCWDTTDSVNVTLTEFKFLCTPSRKPECSFSPLSHFCPVPTELVHSKSEVSLIRKNRSVQCAWNSQMGQWPSNVFEGPSDRGEASASGTGSGAPTWGKRHAANNLGFFFFLRLNWLHSSVGLHSHEGWRIGC